jgi:hypothetical protein
MTVARREFSRTLFQTQRKYITVQYARPLTSEEIRGVDAEGLLRHQTTQHRLIPQGFFKHRLGQGRCQAILTSTTRQRNSQRRLSRLGPTATRIAVGSVVGVGGHAEGDVGEGVVG